ncbi:MAG: tetratricopeptide repeat protein [Methylocystaceae bacterium]|nr:tetratricopeptide repeat protein [Methylocystaceae bacterium]
MPLGKVIEQGTIFEQAGDHASVQKLYTLWIESTESPEKFAAYYNLGVSLANTGQVEAAESAYRSAIAINPQFAQGYLNLGLAVERQGRLQEALTLWNHVVSQGDAVAKEPRIFALNNIGRLNEICKQFEVAENALLASLALNPRQTGVIQHVVSGRQRQCKWPVIIDLPHTRAHDLLASTSALSMLAVSDDPALQWLASLNTLNRFSYREDYLSADKKYQHQKIRIGYLSGDLCTHAVGLLMAELFEAHDRDHFEIYAFDFSPEDGTLFRARLKSAFDHFFDIRNLSDQDAALFILQNEIDVLVDLHGWSSGARPGILSLRPSPLQLTYLGYFGSTVSPWIDYLITDKFVFTDELLPYFSEKPLYIDGTVIPLAYTGFTPTKITRESVGLPEDAVVLVSFNNINKVTPEIFTVWMNILRKTENTILWLLDDNPWATNNLRAEAKKAGQEARVIFAARTNLNDYRERMQLAQ